MRCLETFSQQGMFNEMQLPGGFLVDSNPGEQSSLGQTHIWLGSVQDLRVSIMPDQGQIWAGAGSALANAPLSQSHGEWEF